jgi:hypothetical protein
MCDFLAEALRFPQSLYTLDTKTDVPAELFESVRQRLKLELRTVMRQGSLHILCYQVHTCLGFLSDKLHVQDYDRGVELLHLILPNDLKRVVHEYLY